MSVREHGSSWQAAADKQQAAGRQGHALGFGFGTCSTTGSAEHTRQEHMVASAFRQKHMQTNKETNKQEHIRDATGAGAGGGGGSIKSS
jgi:hypothetical protein